MTASMVINNQMRFQGNATQAMYGMISGAVLNVLFVPLFMFTFGLGILGTAIGTVLSQLFGFIVLWVMSRRGENIPIQLSQASMKWHFQQEILKGVTPSLTRQALASIATLMLNVAAGVYGDAAIAGMSIVSRLAFIIFAIIIGVGQGYQPFCGFNYGAGLYKRLRRGFYFTILLDMAVLLVMCGPAFVFAEELVDLLRDDPEVVAVGAVALRWQLVALPMAAVVTVCNMTLQTTGQSLSANILAAARNGIFFIPLILILPRVMGLFGVEICQAVCDVLAFLLAIPLTVHFFRSTLQKKP
jgi:Na+-driven multidrug efflux pump